MLITRHGTMRFKERQNIKNQHEMKRRAKHAVERGKLLDGVVISPDKKCYLFDGFCYILAGNDKRLVTVFKQNKSSFKNKRALLNNIKIREFRNEIRYPSISC